MKKKDTNPFSAIISANQQGMAEEAPAPAARQERLYQQTWQPGL